jgi:hypothetical protein
MDDEVLVGGRNKVAEVKNADKSGEEPMSEGSRKMFLAGMEAVG